VNSVNWYNKSTYTD